MTWLGLRDIPDESVVDKQPTHTGFLQKLFTQGPGVLKEVLTDPTTYLGGFGPKGLQVLGTLLAQSNPSEAAIFPKGAQISAANRQTVKQASMELNPYLNDPGFGKPYIDKNEAKFISDQYGRTDDPVWEYLEKYGTETEKLTYLRQVLNDIYPGIHKQHLGDKEITAIGTQASKDITRNSTYPTYASVKGYLRSNKPEDTIFGTKARNKLDLDFRSFSSDKLLAILRDRYSDVSTISIDNITRSSALDEVNKAIEFGKRNPQGIPVKDRVTQIGPIIRKKNLAGTEPILDLGSGNQWVRLKSPESFIHEGNKMGHSVGGYAEDPSYGLMGGMNAVEKGDVQVYSLRDNKGHPSVTVEVDGTDGTIVQVKRHGNRTDFTSQETEALDKFIQETDFAFKDHPTYGGSPFDYLPESITSKYKDRHIGRQSPEDIWGPDFGNEPFQLADPPAQVNLPNDMIQRPMDIEMPDPYLGLANLERRAVEEGVADFTDDQLGALMKWLDDGYENNTVDQQALLIDLTEQAKERFIQNAANIDVVAYRDAIAAGNQRQALSYIIDWLQYNAIPF